MLNTRLLFGRREAEAGQARSGAPSRRAMLAFGALLLAGCAPAVGSENPGQVAVRPPALGRDAFISFDGVRLPMNVWRTQYAPKALIVALHGFDDYAGASFALAGPLWAKMGYQTYAYDQRGFGRGPERGRWAGPEPMMEDLRTLVALLREKHPGVPIAVVGESMGGAVAICAFASSRPPEADRLILLSPAVWGWSTQPLVNAVGLWVVDHLDPALSLSPPSFVSDQYRCSDNLKVLKAMDADPYEINATRADATYGLVDLMERASLEIGRVHAPTLYAYGAHDLMIPKAAAFAAAARLGPEGRTAYYPEGWHLLDRDLHAGRVLGDVGAFIATPQEPLPSRPDPIPKPGRITA